MHTEKHENNQNRTKPFLMFLLGFVIAVILVGALSKTKYSGYVGLLELVLVVFAAAGVFVFIKKYLFAYTYVWDGMFLTVYKSIGSRESVLCRIKNAEMLALEYYENEDAFASDYSKMPKNDCRVGTAAGKFAVLKFNDYDAKKDSILVFEPSEELFAIISKSILDKEEQM